MNEPKTYIQVASLIIDGYEYELCIPCWTEEEIKRAEEAAKKFRLLFGSIEISENELTDPDTFPDPED